MESKAEGTIATVEQKLRDLRPSAGVSVGEAARRLGEMRAYLETVDEKLPAILQEIDDVAMTQTRQENLEAATRRRIEWGREAEGLGPLGCLRAIEKSQLRLAMREGKLGVVGGQLIDDRLKVLLTAHRQAIEKLVIEREEFHAVDQEES